jgi:hypothetical protein
MQQSLRAAALAAVLFPCCAGAAEKADIERAIGAGVAALRKLQKTDGRWDYPSPSTSVGATALAGVTLLECGADKDDPNVVAAADYVRTKCPDLRYTYSIALSILFLDRLGSPADEELIESLAARLMAGQCATGAWYYNCPDSKLVDLQVHQLDLAEQGVGPNRQRKESTETERKKRDFVRRVLLLKQQIVGSSEYARGDNSNAMFASLALWVCRRHGLPVEASLRAVDLRFRNTQNLDGGWSYADAGVPIAGEPTTSTPSMTAAGLFCLAVAQGVGDAEADKPEAKANANRNAARDLHVAAGLKGLSRTIGLPLLSLPQSNTPHAGVPVRPSLAGRNYYLLWGIERAAVTLDLDTIGKKDWYLWGSEILLATQMPGGTWEGTFYNGGVDTCFALLFLKKANLAGDLSIKLKGRYQDPGQVELRSAGAGGRALSPAAKDAQTGKPGGQDRLSPNAEESKPGRAPIGQVKPSALGSGPGGRLAEALIEMQSELQQAEIERLRDQKGTVNTEALATAIPYLAAEPRRKAREALADRIARMKLETVGNYLQDEEPEIRRAAALACAIKEAKLLVPQLIALLSDREPVVARAAYAALKDLTGKDFGPAANADEGARKQAVADWQEWWKKQAH